MQPRLERRRYPGEARECTASTHSRKRLCSSIVAISANNLSRTLSPVIISRLNSYPNSKRVFCLQSSSIKPGTWICLYIILYSRRLYCVHITCTSILYSIVSCRSKQCFDTELERLGKSFGSNVRRWSALDSLLETSLPVCYFGRNSAKLISRPTVDSTNSDEVPREIPEEDIGTTERLGCARNSRDKMRVYIPCNRNVTLPCLVNFKPISPY